MHSVWQTKWRKSTKSTSKKSRFLSQTNSGRSPAGVSLLVFPLGNAPHGIRALTGGHQKNCWCSVCRIRDALFVQQATAPSLNSATDIVERRHGFLSGQGWKRVSDFGCTRAWQSAEHWCRALPLRKEFLVFAYRMSRELGVRSWVIEGRKKTGMP